MIQVEICEKKSVEKIIVKGHALFSDYGKDIVCAACSAIVTTSINAMVRYDAKALEYNQKNGVELTILKHTDVIDLLVENMIDLLSQLESQYPKNITIRRCSLC